MGMPRPERPEGESTTDVTETRTASARSGHDVAYVEYGDPDGRPIVFLHGTPGSRVLGELFDDEARRHGVRVLALDRPGYGRSPPWESRFLTDTGEFVVAVLEDAGVSRAGVVGFSGGGPHALAVAATHRERVKEIDIVSGTAPPSVGAPAPTVQRLLGALGQRAPLLLRGVFRGQAWLATYAPSSFVVSQYTTGGQPEIPEAAADLVKRDFITAFETYRDGAATEFSLLSREWDFHAANIDRPVHLWHGTRDTNVPIDDARQMRDRLPNSQLTVFEEADHLRTLLQSRSRILERYGADWGARWRQGV